MIYILNRKKNTELENANLNRANTRKQELIEFDMKATEITFK